MSNIKIFKKEKKKVTTMTLLPETIEHLDSLCQTFQINRSKLIDFLAEKITKEDIEELYTRNQKNVSNF